MVSVLFVACADAVRAQSADEVDAALKKLLVDDRYERGGRFEGDDATTIRSEPKGGRDRGGGFGIGAGAFSAVVGWCLLTLLVVLVAVFLFGMAMNRKPAVKVTRTTPTAEPPPVVETAELPELPSLATADALAARGDYEEALHALLLAMLGRLVQPRAPLPWETSRQVVRWKGLDAGTRSALVPVVEAVEQSRFGGRPALEEDFVRCRASCAGVLESLPSGESPR